MKKALSKKKLKSTFLWKESDLKKSILNNWTIKKNIGVNLDSTGRLMQGSLSYDVIFMFCDVLLYQIHVKYWNLIVEIKRDGARAYHS